MTARIPTKLRAAGFTLVELMVAIALGMLIVLALIALLVNVSRNDSEMSKTSSMIENGRFAMLILKSDVEHAGYWSGFVPAFDDLSLATAPADVPDAFPDLCRSYDTTAWAAVDTDNIVGIPVQGFEIPATGTIATPNCTLTGAGAYDPIVSPKRSTDVLVVRHADTGTTPATPTDGNIYFQAANCGTTRPTPPYVLSSTGLTRQNRNCATTADIRRFVSNIYYVRTYSTAGDGIPTLMRSSFEVASGAVKHQAANALVEGIEGFRVEYGVDNISDSGANVNLSAAITWASPTNLVSPTNRGDGIVDGNYITCTTGTPCTVAQMTNTVAVKIYVLSRNLTTTPGYVDNKEYVLGSTKTTANTLGPFNDNYKRHLFSQTIRLVNPSSRRETP